MICPCGSDWFLEEKLVRPAGVPASHQRVALANRDHPHYRYRCADCGLVYGQEPQPKPVPEPETKPTVSKRKPKAKTE